MKSFIKLGFLYFQLLWHHVTYFTAVTEPERFHSNLGVTYFGLSDFRRAIAHLKHSEAFRHTDDRSFARYNSYYLGFSFMNLGAYPEAIRHLEVYLHLKPDNDYIKESIDWCRRQLADEESGVLSSDITRR